ncbi:4'-phosphopantetheinyl transferase superfamily protein [Shinella sp. S4-D37]|uniref:4'-phosphopantetheinyl transferase family protein n=1 Tax=Shinella sp. S4-D37 TaxID=3161999 RepID=UPI0034667F6B
MFEWSKVADGEWLCAGLAIAMPVSAVLAGFDPDAVLDPAERSQAGRFLKQEDTERYRAAHGLVRLLLGAATGRNAADLSFSRRPGGKPFLLDAGSLDFNLSHGGGWVAVALCRSGRIGIDVEAERPQPFWAEIAGSFLAPDEIASAGAIGHLKIWTAKEAALKAHGAGFAIAPENVTVTAEGVGFTARLPAERFSGVWRRLGDGHVLAVAADDLVPEVAVCENASDLGAVLAELSRFAQATPASR